MKPDKGNGIVILDQTDYWNKMNNVLDDPTKFVCLDADPVKTTFKQENKANVITEEGYKQLSPTCSQPSILYALPNIFYEFGIPLRPILSFVGSHSFNIAKILVPLLCPISFSPFSISDTFCFIQDEF